MTEQRTTKEPKGFLQRNPKLVLIVAGIILLITLGVGVTVIPALSGGGFDATDSQSSVIQTTMLNEFKIGNADAAFLVTADQGSVDTPANYAAGKALAEQVQQTPGVQAVISYWTTADLGGLRGNDGKQALLLVQLAGSQNDKSAWLTSAHTRYDTMHGPISVQIGGDAEVFRAIQDQIVSDLVRTEAIAVPLSLILLLFVFRSLMSALLPLSLGALSAGITFFVLKVLAGFTEVSIFSLNLTSALALGLGIDYGLLMVTRFREELGRGQPVPVAVRNTVRTAGRTVLFSGLTVGLSLATLLLFPLPFLRSFAYAAIPSVAGAILGGLVVLPAMLRLLGHNIEKWPLTRLPKINASEATWAKIATFAIRRRFPVTLLLVIVLGVLAIPFLHVTIGKDDDRVLPTSAPVRTVQQEIRDNFAGNLAYPVNVYLPGLGDNANGHQAQATIAAEITNLPSVSLARGANGIWEHGSKVAPLPGANAVMSNGRDSFLSVVLKPDVDVYSDQAQQTVLDIRAISYQGVHPEVTGESALLIDDVRSIEDHLPWAIALIVLFTFIMTFLLTGSVVVPIKALVLNLLSLTATFGVMVWGFQDGHLQGLLGFTSSGYLDDAMPVLMFCAAFGLSMDYELFLVSRIHEEFVRTGDNKAAVVAGIKKTGAVFTSAALLLAVVFAGLIASKVSIIKMAGLGIVLAVLMDAIVIRSLLVPALMSMMGKANWWAPRFLRRLHTKVRLSEDYEDLDATPQGPVPAAETVDLTTG
ncbi:MAG TPA: MMPL family transporter [Pseudonocardiaceae bacterium]|nr:MMPL family transporter [Pseudonocardiaceae bacterium]